MTENVPIIGDVRCPKENGASEPTSSCAGCEFFAGVIAEIDRSNIDDYYHVPALKIVCEYV